MLDYDDVAAKFDKTMDWLAETYVDALNCVHYMHDKYAYERIEMALHDKTILRTLACGIAGLSVVADSLSAIKYATVHPVRDDTGLVVDYLVDGEYPQLRQRRRPGRRHRRRHRRRLHGEDPPAARPTAARCTPSRC